MVIPMSHAHPPRVEDERRGSYNAPMQNEALPARERILLKANELFYRDGVRATGVDKIIAESEVAKLTFYRHYRSKDDLVRAVLEYRQDLWMAWFVDALGRHGAQTRGGLQVLAFAMEEWFEQPTFRGCAFINIVAELGGTDPDVIDIARRKKQDMVDVIAALLEPQSEARRIADAAALAVDGAIVRAQMSGPAAALESLRFMLSVLDALTAGS